MPLVVEKTGCRDAAWALGGRRFVEGYDCPVGQLRILQGIGAIMFLTECQTRVKHEIALRRLGVRHD